MSPALQAIAATLLVSAISLIGIVFTFQRRRSERNEMLLVSFAAGVLLATAFLDLLPEAMERTHEPRGPLVAALGGMLGFFFLERFLHGFHTHDESHPEDADSHVVASRWLVLIGDGLHNFIDGIVIGAAFLASPALGWATTVAVAAHEIPQEIGDYAILVRSRLTPRRALTLNFLSGLVAILGVLACFAFRELVEPNLPWFLTTTAGMFLYIAASDLIPELHHPRYRASWIYAAPFVLGIALVAVLMRSLGEGH